MELIVHSIAPAIASSTGSGGSKKAKASNILGGIKTNPNAISISNQFVQTATGLVTNTGRMIRGALGGAASASRVGEVTGAANPSINLGTGVDNGAPGRQVTDIPGLSPSGIGNLGLNPNVLGWASQLAMMPGSAGGGMMPPSMPNFGNLSGGNSNSGSTNSSGKEKDPPSVPQRRPEQTTPQRELAPGNPDARLNQMYIDAYKDIKKKDKVGELDKRFEKAIEGVENKKPLQDAYSKFKESMNKDDIKDTDRTNILNNFKKELKDNKIDPEEVLKEMFPGVKIETASKQVFDMTSNIA